MADRKKFNFSVTSKKFLTFNSRDIKTDLMRWDIFNRISLSTFTYNEYFKDYEAKDFVTDFFANPEVQSHLKVFKKGFKELGLFYCPQKIEGAGYFAYVSLRIQVI